VCGDQISFLAAQERLSSGFRGGQSCYLQRARAAFKRIDSYSSSLQGQELQILSREERGAQPAILTGNVAPDKVINDTQLLLFFNSAFSLAALPAAVRDQHFSGNETGKTLLVEWNF